MDRPHGWSSSPHSTSTYRRMDMAGPGAACRVNRRARRCFPGLVPCRDRSGATDENRFAAGSSWSRRRPMYHRDAAAGRSRRMHGRRKGRCRWRACCVRPSHERTVRAVRSLATRARCARHRVKEPGRSPTHYRPHRARRYPPLSITGEYTGQALEYLE